MEITLTGGPGSTVARVGLNAGETGYSWQPWSGYNDWGRKGYDVNRADCADSGRYFCHAPREGHSRGRPLPEARCHGQPEQQGEAEESSSGSTDRRGLGWLYGPGKGGSEKPTTPMRDQCACCQLVLLAVLRMLHV